MKIGYNLQFYDEDKRQFDFVSEFRHLALLLLEAQAEIGSHEPDFPATLEEAKTQSRILS